MTIKLDQAETMSHPTNRSLKCQNSLTRPSCHPSCTTLTCLGPPRRVEPPALSRFSVDLDRKARPPQAPAPCPTRHLQLGTKPRRPDTGAGGLAPDENVCISTHLRPLPLLQGHRRRLLHPLQFWGGGRKTTHPNRDRSCLPEPRARRCSAWLSPGNMTPLASCWGWWRRPPRGAVSDCSV